MSEHDKLIEQMKFVLDALQSTSKQAGSDKHPSSTIRDLASQIELEIKDKYPSAIQLADY